MEKEKSPSPTKRMRSVGENGTGWDGGFAPCVGLRKEDRDFVFAVDPFEYGLELEAFTFGLFALPIAGVQVVGNLWIGGASTPLPSRQALRRV